MDLTVCNLEHPKRIHLLNWNKMGPLEKVHVVSVHEQRCEEAAGEGEMCMKKLAESFHCYVAQLPLTFLLSTVFLDFITDQLPDEGTGRFQIYYSPDGILWLRVRKELYEKLGMQGKREKNLDTFLIQLSLLDEKFKSSRMKGVYIENIERIFLDKCFEHHFGISAANAKSLESICKAASPVPIIPSPFNLHNLPCPIDFIPSTIPESSLVEDWNLWLGSVVNQCNLVIDGPIRDPFINVCRPFAEGSHKFITHFHLSAPLLLPAPFISHLLEQRLQEGDSCEKVCIVGRRRDGLGMAMFLDNSTGNILISSSIALSDSPL